jgi:hypothetical protein
MTNQDKNWILFWVVVFIASAIVLYLTNQI